MKSLFSIPTEKGRTRLSAMEGLRAYAVAIIFILHYVSFLEPKADEMRGWAVPTSGYEAMARYYQSSHYGVDIFFILSGFLIAGLVMRDDFRFGKFFSHRILRIYPAFAVTLIAYIAYAIIVRDAEYWQPGIVLNFLFLNGVPGLGIAPINIVTWSLFFECAFYLIFPILYSLSGGGRARRLTVATIIALAVIILLSVSVSSQYARFAMFFVGAWMKFFKDADISPNVPPTLVIMIYMLASALHLFTDNWMIFIPVYAIPAYLLVDCALKGDNYLSRLLSLPLLRALGNISFSVYLVHTFALRISVDIIKAFGRDYHSTPLLLLVLGLSLTLIMATLSFLCLERPYFTLKKRFDHFYDGLAVPFTSRRVP